MPKDTSEKKGQKKLKQIRRNLLKLDKKLQRIETDISVLSPGDPRIEPDKEGSANV
jgi:hypothetical protein